MTLTQPCPFSLPAQTLGLTGTQTTQLLVEPPWRPAVLWDWVTLTCQGSGTAGATTWYKDGQHWGQEGPEHLTVTQSGIYTCDRPGISLSPPVTVSDSPLVLQMPAQALLEGDTVTLRCQGWWNCTVTSVSFYHEEKGLGGLHDGTGKGTGSPHSLSSPRPSGGSCFQGVPVSTAPRGQVARRDSLVLSRTVATGTGPLSFSWHRKGSGALLGTSPCLELCHTGDSDSGQYRCRVSNRDSVAESDPMNVTVLVPMANATITPGPLSHQVHAGDSMTLQCSVQVGSAPVTFTWQHNRLEVPQGPLLELGDINVGHSGTYQCVATNQLGQDGHHVFQALSPELALEVTPRGHCNKVAAGVSGALLFLLLLVGVIVAWHWWHRVAARKHQERAPPDPPAPPEEGEVLYTHVVVTKRAGASPHATTLQDPQVTNAELRGPQGRPREPGDIYGNVL
ncbi:Fc receptor-like protein 4 [Agelaius tricolor]|uniref:Fc receptor-like protein 4 n=1 Tax=Agelaius tricolor TaxID=9191 RepID=UPI0039F24ABF